MSLSRRFFIATAVPFFAQGSSVLAQTANAATDEVLLAVSPLGDIIVGDANAPLALIQYSSASCSFSAKFQTEVLPEISEAYIKTGKLKLVFRELPQNDTVAAITLLARCLPRERYFEAYEALFASQDAWVKNPNPGPVITRIVTRFGMDKTAFETCLADREKMSQLSAYTQKTVKDLGIEATPTFFLNGQKIYGRKDMTELRTELITVIEAASMP